MDPGQLPCHRDSTFPKDAGPEHIPDPPPGHTMRRPPSRSRALHVPGRTYLRTLSEQEHIPVRRPASSRMRQDCSSKRFRYPGSISGQSSTAPEGFRFLRPSYTRAPRDPHPAPRLCPKHNPGQARTWPPHAPELRQGESGPFPEPNPPGKNFQEGTFPRHTGLPDVRDLPQSHTLSGPPHSFPPERAALPEENVPPA